MERLYGCWSRKGKEVKGEGTKSREGKSPEYAGTSSMDLIKALKDEKRLNNLDDDKPHLIDMLEKAKNTKSYDRVLNAVNRVVEVYGELDYTSDYTSGIQTSVSSSENTKISLLGAHSVEKSSKKPNQDAFFCDEEHQSFGVFDGAGNDPYPELGSQLVRDLAKERLSQLPNNVEDAKKAVGPMIKYIKTRHRLKYDEMFNKQCYTLLETTATFGRILGGRKLLIVTTGDSRFYLQKKGFQSVVQLTHDGSKDENGDLWPWAYQKVGAYLASFEDLSPELDQYLKMRHRSDGSIASGENDDPEGFSHRLYVYDVSRGDKIIATSDGIHDNLTDDQISHIVSTSNEPAKDLVAEAKKISKKQHQDRAISRYRRPKPDDMTAIVIQVE